jgi:hypothetical protein
MAEQAGNFVVRETLQPHLPNTIHDWRHAGRGRQSSAEGIVNPWLLIGHLLDAVTPETEIIAAKFQLS